MNFIAGMDLIFPQSYFSSMFGIPLKVSCLGRRFKVEVNILNLAKSGVDNGPLRAEISNHKEKQDRPTVYNAKQILYLRH